MRQRNHKMRHLVARAISNAWAIDPEKADAICELLTLRASGHEYEPHEIAARIAGPQSTPRPAPASPAGTSAGGPSRVAVVSIVGTIVPRRIDAENVSGGGLVSAEQISKAFGQLAADPQISAIVLDISSPGGAVAGVPELAAQIFAARRSGKRIVAVANQQMASAAYWIGAQASEVVASPSADVGSVGVLAIYSETSQADAADGITTTVFRSTPYKAELNGVEPLTDAARQHVQQRIAGVHQQFLQALAQARGVTPGVVAERFGQGRTLTAPEALAAGMIDRIATLDEVVAELVGGGAPTSSGPAFSPGATAPPLTSSLMETLTMDPRLLTALVRLGAIDVTATQEQASVALTAVLAARGVAAAASIDEQLAALTPHHVPPTAPAPPAPSAPVAPVDHAALHAVAAPLPVPAPAAGISAGDLTAMVRMAPISADQQIALLSELLPQAQTITINAAVSRINAVAAQQNVPVGPRVAVVANDVDNFRTAARDAILTRAWNHSLPSTITTMVDGAAQTVPWNAPAAQNYGLSSLVSLARESLIRCGHPAVAVSRLPDATIARLAMGADPRQFGLSASDPAYNVSGMFSNILYDASNVMLRRSYNEAPVTFNQWMGRGEDVRDFKDVHKVIGGELSEPAAVPENAEFEERTLTDGRERYSLTVWGERFSISWQAVVNDQLSAFTEIPVKQGNAMRRKMNRLAYGVLKDNAALSDNIALFNASHNNLTTGVATPTVATLNTMMKKMAEQTGLNASVFVGAPPKYILFPYALWATVSTLLGSLADPASSNAAAINAVQKMMLTPIVDVELGAAATGGSDTAWYLATDFNAISTIEYAFLQGLTEPAYESVVDFDRLAIKSRVYQAFAVKALDYRGLQKHNGV